MQNQIPSDAGPQPLGIEAFRYFSEKSPESLSSFVDFLISQHEIASLHSALCAGVLDGLRVNAAVTHCATMLVTYAKKVEGLTGEQERPLELQLAKDWLTRGVERFGSVFTEQIVDNLLGRGGLANFGSMMDVLRAPEFGLDLVSDIRLSHEQKEQWSDREPVYNMLGRIADSYRVVALDLAGPMVETFPDTAIFPPQKDGQSWVTMNLAEQIVIYNSTDQALLSKMVGMTRPGSPARQQLGDLALVLLVNEDKEFVQQMQGRGASIAEKKALVVDDEALTLRNAIILVGAGVEFLDPDAFWGYVRTASTDAFTASFKNRNAAVPVAHAVLHISADSCSQDLAAKALRRMVLEGGIAPNLRDNVGRTLLQAAAAKGQTSAVEMLLDLESDPAFDYGSENRKRAAEIADTEGHQVIAKMIRAHQAQEAINSVLSKRNSPTGPA
jgi:hypothetical protein